MRALFAALVGVYTRWRYVEDLDVPAAPVRKPERKESPKDEISRLRTAIDRERRNLQSYLRFQCAALAGPCEASILAMESRIHALELMGRRAV
ncbi:MAG TPA: hypothetical protein VE981_00445 [Planctomycetota bacterium]|nr:hypothetical protein [Planctomycetota bacterium]